MLVRNFRQRFLVEIDGMNRAAGSQQLRKRGCERSVAAAKIAPELRSPPLNVGCMNQRRGLTDLYLYTVFLTDGKPPSRYDRSGRIIANPKPTIANQLLGLRTHGLFAVNSDVIEKHARASSKTMWKLLTTDRG